MNARWVAIQRNPRSGTGRRSREILELIRECKRLGIKPRLYANREELDAAVNDPERAKTLIGIVAAGGDGTLLDVINRHPHLKIGLLPLGNENLVAKQIQVKRDGVAVARMLDLGKTRAFDLACCGSKNFLIMASCGFDADVIHRVHNNRKGHVNRWSYIKAIFASLWKYDYPRFKVYCDNDLVPLEGALVVVANLKGYAMHLPVVPTAIGDDGILDVRVFERSGSWNLIRYLLSAIGFRRHEHLKDVKKIRAKLVQIECETPIPMQTDGDPVGFAPRFMYITSKRVQLFVP